MWRIAVFLLGWIMLMDGAFASSEPLRVSYLNRPPYYYTEQGEAKGFLVDLTRQILVEAHIDATFVELPPNRILVEIQEGKLPNCSIGWFKTQEREAFASFSLPIYQNKPIVILTRRQNQQLFAAYTTLKQVFADQSLLFGTMDAFSYGEYIDQLRKELSPRVHSIAANPKSLILMLFNDRLTYLLNAPEEIETVIRSANLDPNDFVAIPMSDIPVGNKRHLMCSNTVSEEVMNRINQAISAIIGSETFK